MSPLRNVLVILCAAAPVCLATSVDLGSSANYAVLGLASTTIQDQANTKITGTEGIAQFGKITATNSAVNGNVVEYTTGQYSGNGTYTSMVNNTSIMSDANAAMTAYNNAITLTATQTLGTINNTSETITGTSGLNVLSISSITLNNNQSLTLSGTASTEFIVLVSGNVTLNGNGGLEVGGGVTAADVLYVFDGASGAAFNTQKANTVYGTVLAPNYNVNLQGTLTGELIGGSSKNNITLNGATINYDKFNPPAIASPLKVPAAVPEPGTYLITGLGLAMLGGVSRFVRRRRAS